MNALKAFHNKPSIKAKYLKRVRLHAKADEIVKGKYWQNGKGCAVGCTIHSSDHQQFEIELGIPEWLARVEDTLFEGLPNNRAKTWPIKFLSSIKPGVNLEQVKIPFICFILESSIESMNSVKFDSIKFPQVKIVIEQSKKAVQLMIIAYKKNDSAAYSAAYSATYSAASAAYSAASAASATYSAASAAYSAADSAASAASAASATYSAARSIAYSVADSADSSAYSSARSTACEKFADKLIKLLRNCK